MILILCYAIVLWLFCSYRWLYNDSPLNVSDTGGRISLAADSGTLVFTETTAQDEGIYQCVAYNALGTALSEKVHLRQASTSLVARQYFKNLSLHFGDFCARAEGLADNPATAGTPDRPDPTRYPRVGSGRVGIYCDGLGRVRVYCDGSGWVGIYCHGSGRYIL